MMLAEEQLASNAYVIGTDLSRERLRVAQRGRYRAWSMRGVRDEVVSRYFTKKRDYFELSPAIRNMAEFRYLNLDFDNYPSPALGVWGMDLILCRNVLIYFDIETVASVAEKLLASLNDHGWLFLGASDPMLADLVECEVVMTSSGLAYRRPRADAAPRPRLRPPEGTLPSLPSLPPTASDPAFWSKPGVFPAPPASLPPIAASAGVPPSFEPTLATPFVWPPVSDVASQTPSTSDPRTHDLSSNGAYGTLPGTLPGALHDGLGRPTTDTHATSMLSSAASSDAGASPKTVAWLRALYDTRDYAAVVRHADAILQATGEQDAAWIIYVRALANLGRLADAERTCTAALDRYGTSAELWYLQAILLAEAARPIESAQAARRAIYLDRQLAVAHMALGTALRKSGDIAGARLAFTNTLRALETLPPNAVVPGSDGETSERIAMAARVHLQLAEEVA